MSGPRRRPIPAGSLLNFSYLLPAFENAPRRGSLRYGAPFSKNRHVRANFRFALSPSISSNGYSIDDPIDWDSVILVNQLVENPPCCPICLDILIAPRITKCGHSTCLKCILHYFSLSQRNCARCVLCAEPVYVGDLRCLTFDVLLPYNAKNNATFVLCKRLNSSSEVLPIAAVTTSSPFQFCSVIVGYDLLPIHQKEYQDITSALILTEPDEALDCVKKRIASLAGNIEPLDSNPSSSHVDTVATDSHSDRDYFFYQCLDGQFLFLNSFSFRCLLHDCGGVENLPHEISAPILDVVRIRQTESSRSKYRFIAHLPITTNYSLCDIELEHLVKKSTLRHFRDTLQQQAKIRAKHKARQKRDEKKMEAINQERENEMRHRSRIFAPISNPFQVADPEDFGPAIGNAQKSPAKTSLAVWSAVADKGLMALEAWEPLPSHPRVQAPNPVAPDGRAVSFSSVVVGSHSTPMAQPLLKSPKGKQSSAKQNILFSNTGNRQYKNQ